MVNGRQHERSWVVDHRMMSSSIAPTSTKAASGRNSRKNFVSSSKPSSNHPSMPPAGHGSTSVSTSGPVSFASIKMRRQSAAAQAHVDRRTTATTGFQGGSQERLVDSFVTAPTGNADFNGLSQMSQESWPASANSFSSANGGYQLGQKSFSLSQSSGGSVPSARSQTTASNSRNGQIFRSSNALRFDQLPKRRPQSVHRAAPSKMQSGSNTQKKIMSALAPLPCCPPHNDRVSPLLVGPQVLAHRFNTQSDPRPASANGMNTQALTKTVKTVAETICGELATKIDGEIQATFNLRMEELETARKQHESALEVKQQSVIKTLDDKTQDGISTLTNKTTDGVDEIDRSTSNGVHQVKGTTKAAGDEIKTLTDDGVRKVQLAFQDGIKKLQAATQKGVDRFTTWTQKWYQQFTARTLAQNPSTTGAPLKTPPPKSAGKRTVVTQNGKESKRDAKVVYTTSDHGKDRGVAKKAGKSTSGSKHGRKPVVVRKSPTNECGNTSPKDNQDRKTSSARSKHRASSPAKRGRCPLAPLTVVHQGCKSGPRRSCVSPCLNTEQEASGRENRSTKNPVKSKKRQLCFGSSPTPRHKRTKFQGIGLPDYDDDPDTIAFRQYSQ